MKKLHALKRVGVFVAFLWVTTGLFVFWWGIDSVQGKNAGEGPAAENMSGSSDYWADKAGLCATYGNNTAAVTYYQKAIDLNPGQSNLYFLMGISLGETGQYEKALEAINKAISLDPGNPRYLYGRGRLGLKAGNTESAMADLESAAKAGDMDARKHMNSLTR